MLSLGSIIQYFFLAAIAYVLAGAPLLSLLSPPSSSVASKKGNVVDVRTLDSLVIPEKNLSCGAHAYKGVYVLSREPLVVYIEGFLGERESEEVLRISEPHFKPSTVFNAGVESLDPSVRLSEKAPLPRSQTVKCIEDRARTFQGWQPHTFVEKLWSQRYGVGGHYTYHYDWSSASKSGGRVSSFMVYVAANCTGGGTHFPRLQKPVDRSWCRFIECDAEPSNQGGKEDLSQGVIFKPIAGNAVFWENMRSDGTGYSESWHAGLPVTKGSKVGLNIWSWRIDGYVPEEAGEQ